MQQGIVPDIASAIIQDVSLNLQGRKFRQTHRFSCHGVQARHEGGMIGWRSNLQETDFIASVNPSRR